MDEVEDKDKRMDCGGEFGCEEALSQTLHVLYAYIDHHPNVCKYGIHGVSGYGQDPQKNTL